MTEQKSEKPDLSKIDPIGRAPDAEDEDAAEREADRIGRVSAAVSGAAPAVGVEADAEERSREAEAMNSPETEEQLDQLRRS